jgi:hypothetical protein
MYTQKVKKQVVVLPENFQETLIKHEMRYESDIIDVELIRNLVYLYTVKIK